ncbi:FkbM family methyltransferase [Aureimonas leprariae]|uniref:FkbM family methyltransferase n=1 Tax=Plantimonas leprariae TaxID=2615207 RepID=A0A7V7PM20_9HYPH|nr:FkbM family methyltransferase [Aureimonas leprariae]KAB0677761.1 FkbM family methyltransferase [Aureimonas leprariae]
MSLPTPRVLAVRATLDDSEALREALRRVDADGAEWLMLLDSGEAPSEAASLRAAPALPLFDAVFGGLETARGLWRPSRLAFDEAERLPHALLNWWVGEPRFLRAATLRNLLEDGSGEGRIARLFRLWATARCIKLAAPLVIAETEPAAGLTEAERGEVLRRLEERPAFLPIPYGDRIWRVPYTGRNAGIERDQTRGVFFEAAELEYVKARVGTGVRVVDVGANTGNHTVFFAGPMRAASVLPFEPLPQAAATLRLAVEANGFANVDLSMLGQGVGAEPARMHAVVSEGGGLGATRLEAGGEGGVPVVRLDDILTEPPGFLKIDVEGMELDVLRGASETIARARPPIFVEVAERNTGAFLDWLELASYRIERIFSDKGHANYLIAPLDS